MKSFRKFIVLVDADNTNLNADSLKKHIEKVETLGSIVYIKIYGCNDSKIKEFSEIINGRCCDTAPAMRSKFKARKSGIDTRIIVDAMKIASSGVADSFAIIAGEGDYGYMLSALKAMGKFIVGRFFSDVNINFCDVFLADFEQQYTEGEDINKI